MSLEPMDEIDQFPVGDDPESMLVDSNMIPTAATEVVMSGDGIQREFESGNDDESYQYEYTYEDDPDHPHLEMEEEEEVVVTEEEYPASWKSSEHKKLNLYEVLDSHVHNKMYMEEKPPKRARLDDSRFYQSTGQGSGTSGTGTNDYFPAGDVEEYREFAVFPNKQQSADRPCPGCGMTLRRSVFYHHARMIREKGACNVFTPQRFPCTQCDARIGTLEKLCQHMEQIHNAPTQVKTAMFSDEEAFTLFRIELEGKGGNFRMARGNKKNKKGTVQYFRCNRLQTLSRAQTYRPVDNPPIGTLPSNRKKGRLHQQEVRSNSAKQVIRTENSCTAFYNKAYIANGIIEVRYCEHHLHDDEKLRLPDAVRKRVIELARKNLPHVVILMIVKDERLNYCEKNSANDRRIQEMKTQDIRQVLAGNNRAERTKAQRGERAQKDLFYEKTDGSSEITISTEDVDATRSWTDVRPAQKIDRHSLTQHELRYLDLFDSNREEIMAKLNEKTRSEQNKKMLYDSFIHRLSSSQEVVRHLHYRQLIASESTLAKLKKVFTYLSKIEDLVLNPRRETAPAQTSAVRFTSYLRMLEEEAQLDDDDAARVAGGTGGTGAGAGGPMEEIDVVGIDEDEFIRHHHHHHHEIVEEQEVGYHEEIGDEEEEDEDGGYIESQIVGVEEIAMEETAQETLMEEPEVEEEQEEHVEEQEEEPESATVTRAGRIVKKKPLFDS